MRNSLFDNIEERKTDDASILKKAKAKKVATTTQRRGTTLLSQIRRIVETVDLYLGKYADETIIIRDIQTLHDYIGACLNNQQVSIDTETTGLDPMVDIIVGVCLYTPGEKTAYIPLEHINYITLQKEPNQLSREFVAEEMKRLVLCKEIVEHNAKFDTRMMRHSLSINLVATWDTYLASMLIDENPDTHALKLLHLNWVLGGEGDAFKYEELFKGVDFRHVPIRTASLYAAHDPKITWELMEWEKEHIDEQSLWVLENIEMPCVQVLADMEDTGITLDTQYADVLKVKYNQMKVEALETFYKTLEPYDGKLQQARLNGAKIDDPINIGSPAQLAILFYDVMKITPPDPKTPRGTGSEILQSMDNDIARAILDYRGIEKLLSTYIEKLPECILVDGRIHCNFNQYGAKTGRMSSDRPNLQNIPSHNKDVRKMFVATDGYLLMSSDFSQQEPKCLAALCRKAGDSQMYDTFMIGKDLYSEIASKSFHKPYEECLEHFPKGTKIIKGTHGNWYYSPDGRYDKIADGEDVYLQGKARRAQAKSILLGVLYGRGITSIAEQLHTAFEEAQQIKDSVFRAFPAIKKFEEDSLEMARNVGYVTTVCGRKRRLPDLQLDEYEFRWVDGVSPYEDPLDFDHDTSDIPVPKMVQEKYLKSLKRCKFNEKRKVFEKANKDDHVWIVDNGGKIADATRQCVNARIQGSAADLTKIAMIELHKNEELKALGFRMLVPVHDEVICECPEENIKRCSELLAETMSKAAEQILEMPIRCDVEISREWYGKKVEVT